MKSLQKLIRTTKILNVDVDYSDERIMVIIILFTLCTQSIEIELPVFFLRMNLN
jgi:hypothetical protein